MNSNSISGGSGSGRHANLISRKVQEEALFEARGRASTQKMNAYTVPSTINEYLKTELELMVKKREEHKKNSNLYKQCAGENIKELVLKMDNYGDERNGIIDLIMNEADKHRTREFVASVTDTIIYVARALLVEVRLLNGTKSNDSSPLPPPSHPIPTYNQIYTKIRVEEGRAGPPKTPAQNKEDYVKHIKSGKIPTIPGSDNHFTQNRKLYMEMNHEPTVQNKRVLSHYPQPKKDVKDGTLDIQLYHADELKDSDKNKIISVVGKGFAKNKDDGSFSDTDAKVAYKLLYPKGEKKEKKKKRKQKLQRLYISTWILQRRMRWRYLSE